MTTFEAIAHSLTTISTAGFSTSDSSMGRWDLPALHWAAILFMLAGSLPFVLYVRLVRGEHAALWDQQVRTFFSVLAIIIAGLAIGLIATGQYGVADALRHAAFNTVSVVTTTGYATTDSGQWGTVVIAAFFLLTFVGGCTGSTTGGIKIFRFEVMWILLRSHFLLLLHPRAVVAKRYAKRPLPDDVVGSVVVFMALFFVCYSLLTVALMGFGLDFLTSASGAATALANVGPGLGDIIGPAGNFSTLPDGAKWLLSFAMLLGRLELFTVLILFVPRFWRG
jgi:trk system potassium uptake protein TrkH